MAHAQHPLARFPHDGKGLRQQLIQHRPLIIERASIVQTLTELRRASTEVVIAEGRDLFLEQIDIRNNRLIALQLAGIWVTQQELEHINKEKYENTLPSGETRRKEK